MDIITSYDHIKKRFGTKMCYGSLSNSDSVTNYRPTYIVAEGGHKSIMWFMHYTQRQLRIKFKSLEHCCIMELFCIPGIAKMRKTFSLFRPTSLF